MRKSCTELNDNLSVRRCGILAARYLTDPECFVNVRQECRTSYKYLLCYKLNVNSYLYVMMLHCIDNLSLYYQTLASICPSIN